MKGSCPDQAALTRDTDMTRTDDNRAVIQGMVDGLNDHRIDDIGQFFCTEFPLDGQSGSRSQERIAGISEQLAAPFSGDPFG